MVKNTTRKVRLEQLHVFIRFMLCTEQRQFGASRNSKPYAAVRHSHLFDRRNLHSWQKLFTGGRIEVCAKLQGAQGAWPAIWMLPEGANWPNGGEIDIMERLNHDSIAYQTTHSYYTQVLGEKTNPPHGGVNKINPTEYNIYSVDIYPDSLVYAINHKHTYTYPRIQTDKEGQFPFFQPYYLLIDMQLGGAWVGNVNPAELPVEMHIDWVRYYKKY